MIDANAARTAARRIVSEMVGFQVSDSEPIVSSGLIDSLSVLKLIARLEEALAVTIPSQELQPEDFDHVNLIVETLQRVATTL